MSKTAPPPPKPGLYGLHHGNSNRKDEAMWGKNCFNSCFPAALACHMRDARHKPVLISTTGFGTGGGRAHIKNTEISVDEVFGTTKPNVQLRFLFEHAFPPYQAYDHTGGQLDKADLTLQDDAEEYLRQFQIKLTVTPDNNTSERPEAEWAPELVLRSADTSLCAIGMFHAVASQLGADGVAQIKKLFHDPCYGLRWDALGEDHAAQEKLREKAMAFIDAFQAHQQPFLLNAIWKTNGKTPHLCEQHALDIFMWSDHALIAACIDKASGRKTRGDRAVAKFARAMYELAQHTKINLHAIYRAEMGFGRQTDKEMALSGLETQKYMPSPRRTNPLLPAECLRHIILNGGHKKLSPERRFDQTVYFTADRIFGD